MKTGMSSPIPATKQNDNNSPEKSVLHEPKQFVEAWIYYPEVVNTTRLSQDREMTVERSIITHQLPALHQAPRCVKNLDREDSDR